MLLASEKKMLEKRFGVDVPVPQATKVQRRSLLETNVVQYILRCYFYINLSM